MPYLHNYDENINPNLIWM